MWTDKGFFGWILMLVVVVTKTKVVRGRDTTLSQAADTTPAMPRVHTMDHIGLHIKDIVMNVIVLCNVVEHRVCLVAMVM